MNKKIILFSLLLILIFGLLIYFVNKSNEKYEYFSGKQYELNNNILNLTKHTYIDTILHNTLNHLNIENKNIIVRPIDNKTREYFLMDPTVHYNAFIVYQNESTYTIFISETDRLNHIEIIAHEIIHLKQYDDKRLKIEPLDKRYIYFDGIKYNVDKIDYFNRPWEIEAFREQVPLYDTLKILLY